MKHDLFATPALPVMSGALSLTLRLVESVGVDGKPVLAACLQNAVLTPSSFPEDAAGDFAVCMEMDGGTLVVLGYLPASAIAEAMMARPDSEKPLTLKSGRSELVLHPDGRVRITGDDVIVQSNGRMGLKGAIVDLN